jgi:predicted  nucleic acid-binding Zn-ribbon protein
MNFSTIDGEFFERKCAKCGAMFKPNSSETLFLCNNCLWVDSLNDSEEAEVSTVILKSTTNFLFTFFIDCIIEISIELIAYFIESIIEALLEADFD